MTKRILVLITFVLLTSSCSIYHINSVDSGDTYYPSKSVNDVVYLESVDQSYEVIGTVTVNGERKQRSIDDIILKMKREAAILGGNAITDLKTDATGVWKKLPVQQTIGNAYVRSNFTASVVVIEGLITEDPVSEELITEDLINTDPMAEDQVTEDSGSL